MSWGGRGRCQWCVYQSSAYLWRLWVLYCPGCLAASLAIPKVVTSAPVRSASTCSASASSHLPTHGHKAVICDCCTTAAHACPPAPQIASTRCLTQGTCGTLPSPSPPAHATTSHACSRARVRTRPVAVRAPALNAVLHYAAFISSCQHLWACWQAMSRYNPHCPPALATMHRVCAP